MDEKHEKEVFARCMGYYELRPKREQVIRHFVRGSDVFVSIPTGGGSALDEDEHGACDHLLSYLR